MVKNVLIISHVKSECLSNGGAVHTQSLVNLINYLYPNCKISEIYFVDRISKYNKTIAKIRALTTSIVTSHSSKSVYFKSESFRKRLINVISCNAIDLILIDHAEMLWTLDYLPPNIPTIHLSHNVESALYFEFINNYLDIPLIGKFLLHDAEKYKYYEDKYASLIKNIITISTEDANYFSRLHDDMNVSVINPFFTYPRRSHILRPNKNDKLILGFLANMEWWPNRDAFQWLDKSVLPHLRIPYELRVYGNKSESLTNGDNIIGKGFVKDLAELWEEVDLIVNPIISGGGVNIKVAEAIYNRMPMICTSKALRGLDIMPESSIVVLNTSEEWINFINNVKVPLKSFFKCTFANADKFGIVQRSVVLKKYIELITPEKESA